MKKSLAKIVVLTILTFFISCSNEKEETYSSTINAEQIETNNNMETISEFVLEIGENQSSLQKSNTNSSTTFLPSCVTITSVTTSNTWTRTVDFGTTGCEYYNGAILKGKIIYSGSIDFNEQEYIVSYTFDAFYYDDILVDGSKTFTKSNQSTTLNNEEHPVSILDIDMTFTFPNNEVYERQGIKTREMVEGYDTFFNIFDNKYLTTGTWSTYNQGSMINNGIIQSPLENRSLCPYTVSGILELNYNGNNSVINFGNGACNNTAELSYNGGAPIIIHL